MVFESPLEYRLHIWDDNNSFLKGSKKSFRRLDHAMAWAIYYGVQKYPEEDFNEFIIENHPKWGECYVSHGDDKHITLISMAS